MQISMEYPIYFIIACYTIVTRAGVVVYWLRALAALAESPVSIPSTYKVAHSQSQGSKASLFPLWTHTHRQSINTHVTD